MSDLSPNSQVSLLRFLQEKTIERVGGDDTLHVDARIIAATHTDLATAVAQGRFREDLFFRLEVVPLRVPPLRERVEDIEPLAELYLEKYAAESPQRIRGFNREAREAMRGYTWPGNVRELINRVWCAVVMCETRNLLTKKALGLDADGEGIDIGCDTLDDARMSAERDTLERALQQFPDNMSKVAQLLGISRRSLYRLLEKHGGRESLAQGHSNDGDAGNT